VTFIEDDDRMLLKEVVKKGKVNLKQRIVPQQAVSQWQSKLERLHPEVGAVIAEEREEREIRKAEMEATKAQNMLDHEAEIYSRPARTWFQSSKEKAAAAARAKASEVDGVAPEQQQQQPNEVKEKKSDKNARLKAKREADSQKAKVPQLQSETEAFSKNIKSIKSKVRELVQQGVPANKASKIAAAAVTGKTTKHSKKKRKTGDGGQEDGGLFSGDGLSKPAGPNGANSSSGGGKGGGTGGHRTGKKERASQLSRVDINRLKRGGKGKKAFKSKKKHKRR